MSPATVKDELSKIFYPTNERVGALLELSSKHFKKSTKKFVVLTVSITKTTHIQLYLLKKSDKTDWKKIFICDTNNIKKFDCRDSKLQPSYDLQINTEYKTWSFTAAKLDAKLQFLITLCRIVRSLQPDLFQNLPLTNVPSNFDASLIEEHHSLESLLEPEGDEPKAGEDAAGGRIRRDTDTYRSLTAREEADIRLVLDEFDSAPICKTALEWTELLQKRLDEVEGSNIHSIMASESQVLQLLSNLQESIQKANELEVLTNKHQQFIADVEESMGVLQDHDQLVHLTRNNEMNLLKTLDNLITRLYLDEKVVRILKEMDLTSSEKIIQCAEATEKLDAILNMGSVEGIEQMEAFKERMTELQALSDASAASLTKQVNDWLVQFANQLMCMTKVSSTGGSGSGSSVSDTNRAANAIKNARSTAELYANQRMFLMDMAPLIGEWLQKNRRDLFIGIKQTYGSRMHRFFTHQTEDLFDAVEQTITSYLRPSKSHRVAELAQSDMGSTMSLHKVEDKATMQVMSTFSDLFGTIRELIQTEEQFIAQFFNIQLDFSNKPTSLRGEDQYESLNDFMQYLFQRLGVQSNTFLNKCEQIHNIVVVPLTVVLVRLIAQDPATHAGGLTLKQTPGSNCALNSVFWDGYSKSLIHFAKRALDRYVERLVSTFKAEKPSKKSRCGLLRMVRTYVEFADLCIQLLSPDFAVTEFEEAHHELVVVIMDQLDRVASESVKTPREVVLMENYHKLNDTLRRLKLSGLDSYRSETKSRYTRALLEYTTNSMGRPLEKLTTFFEGVQQSLEAGVRTEVIQYRSSFSKHELRKVIKVYPGKEVKRGLESLCKKVEKHLSDEANLFAVVWGSIQKEFLDQCVRFNLLINECYPDTGITLEFTTDNLQRYFSEIARSR